MDKVFVSLYYIRDQHVTELISQLCKTLEKFPDAVIHTEYDYDSSDTSVGVFIEVPPHFKQNIDKVWLEYKKLPDGIPDRVLVKTQDTPIPDVFLEAIRNDGSNDRYILSLDGTTLHRILKKEEWEQLRKPTVEEKRAMWDKVSAAEKERKEYIDKKTLELRQQL